MIDPGALLETFGAIGPTAWFGVPDSVLAPLVDHPQTPPVRVCANEGAAVAAAVGHFVATGETPFVFLQNSGLGNCVNPLLSMADPDLLSVPIVMIVGWRGRPGDRSDEPHHRRQGAATVALLKSMGIPMTILEKGPAADTRIRDLCERAAAERRPVAVLVPRRTFASEGPGASRPGPSDDGVSYDALFATLLETLRRPTLFVASAGYGSRSLAAVWEAEEPARHARLTNPGGMGHALALAASIAGAKPKTRVVMTQGDGATLMHLGSLASTGASLPENLLILVANNRRHESVGGAATCAPQLGFAHLAEACGFDQSETVVTTAALKRIAHRWDDTGGARCVEVRLARSCVVPPRPRSAPRTEVEDVMEWLRCN